MKTTLLVIIFLVTSTIYANAATYCPQYIQCHYNKDNFSQSLAMTCGISCTTNNNCHMEYWDIKNRSGIKRVGKAMFYIAIIDNKTGKILCGYRFNRNPNFITYIPAKVNLQPTWQGNTCQSEQAEQCALQLISQKNNT